MKVKIGDKVTVTKTDATCKKYMGKIGKVIEIDRIKHGFSSQWDFRVVFDNDFSYPFNLKEVTIITKNQQLLFSFME